jgi:hypothetical protein
MPLFIRQAASIADAQRLVALSGARGAVDGTFRALQSGRFVNPSAVSV